MRAVYFHMLGFMLIYRNSCLVKETKAHVVVGFFFGLFFLFLFGSFCGRCGTTSSGGGRCSGPTSRWNRCQFGVAFGDQFFDVLASQFFDDNSNLFAVALDTDDIQEFFDVGLTDISTSKGD